MPALGPHLARINSNRRITCLDHHSRRKAFQHLRVIPRMPSLLEPLANLNHLHQPHNSRRRSAFHHKADQPEISTSAPDHLATTLLPTSATSSQASKILLEQTLSAAAPANSTSALQVDNQMDRSLEPASHKASKGRYLVNRRWEPLIKIHSNL